MSVQVEVKRRINTVELVCKWQPVFSVSVEKGREGGEGRKGASEGRRVKWEAVAGCGEDSRQVRAGDVVGENTNLNKPKPYSLPG